MNLSHQLTITTSNITYNPFIKLIYKKYTSYNGQKCIALNNNWRNNQSNFIKIAMINIRDVPDIR